MLPLEYRTGAAGAAVDLMTGWTMGAGPGFASSPAFCSSYFFCFFFAFFLYAAVMVFSGSCFSGASVFGVGAGGVGAALAGGAAFLGSGDILAGSGFFFSLGASGLTGARSGAFLGAGFARS